MKVLRPSPSLMRWFTPGLYIKRWLLLLFVSIVMISLAVGYVLRDIYSSSFRFPAVVQEITLQFLPRAVRAVLFAVAGMAILLLCFYKLGQSLLGPFLRAGHTSERRNLIEHLYAHRQLAKGPRVVALGGGTGLSTLLRGIKKYTGNIVAIVTVADDGGSSGRLREEYRVLPPGDFRQCLTALAETEPLMTQLFQHRFTGEGSLGGHSFGNLFIMAMAEITGDFEHALRESGRVLAVRGTIVPSTLKDVVLCATSGDTVRVGESHVPHGVGEDRIDRVFLQPDSPPINPEAEAAILDAELVIVGPGSLYTSILPNLLVDGMVEVLRATPAIKVYVCNVASQPGETQGYTVSEHLSAIEHHVGGNLFDYVIVNSNLAPALPASAQAAGTSRILFDRDEASRKPVHYILADVVSPAVSSHHDPEKLARVIMKRIWR
ncbi:MAG: YvcK family protein [Candidatus Dormibacteraeota bacterium]|nr:YvcK family protein [Candidatus Dormibacteraeota bacterium]